MDERINAIYARQSVDKADSISIESQIEFCKYEIRNESYTIFQDKGFSGKNTDRPEFQKMIKAVCENRIKRIVCYKLDRCSRSILDFSNLMELLQVHKVEFVSCTEKFDTSSPMGRAMLHICIVFAQLERETIQQRVFDAYYSRCKKGFFMGGKVPYGFRSELYFIDGKKTLRYVICQKEADVLCKMYEVYAKPYTSAQDVIDRVCRDDDRVWQRTHIGRMLYNPCYVKADQSVYRYFSGKGVMIHNPEDDFIGTNGCYLYHESKKEKSKNQIAHLVLAPHEGIIDARTWLKCRSKMRSKTIR